MSSNFGQVFRISTWGESHGAGVGVVIDGCPSLVPVTEEDIQRELDRRRPGQSDIVTPRKEEDRAEILSGVLDGRTLGTPIAISVREGCGLALEQAEPLATAKPARSSLPTSVSPPYRGQIRPVILSSFRRKLTNIGPAIHRFSPIMRATIKRANRCRKRCAKKCSLPRSLIKAMT